MRRRTSNTRRPRVLHRATPLIATVAVLASALHPILAATGGTLEVNLLSRNQQTFEGSPTGWVDGPIATSTRSTQYAAEGRYSLKVVADGPKYKGTRAIDVATLSGNSGVRVVPGASYDARLQVRPSRTSTTKVACQLEWFASDGTGIGRSARSWVTEEPTRWTTLSCSGVAPSGSAFAALRVEFSAVYRGDAHYVDDAALSGAVPNESTEPPVVANLLDTDQNGFEDALRGWVTQGNASIARSTAFAISGAASMSVTGSTADPVYVDGTRTVRVGTSPGPGGVSITAGATYTGSVAVMSPWESSPVRCELRFYSPDGLIVATTPGLDAHETPGVWSRRDCTAVAPIGATHAALRVVVGDADTGDVHFVDDAWLTQGDVPPATTGVTSTTWPATTAPLTVAPAPVMTTPSPATATTTVTPTVPPAAATTLAPAPSPTSTIAPTIAPAPATTAAPTSTAPASTTTVVTTTTQPPPPPGGVPTSSSTGPRVANPASIGRLEVTGSQSISDVVVDSIVVHGGGQLTATNVRVTGSIAVIPRLGAPTTKLHLTNSAVHAGLTINAVDGAGNLYWGGEIPVDVAVTGSWIHHPQGDGQYHTEALAGFGWPRGARFTNTAFIQAGPFNATATATTNWHGADTTFDGCYFGWTAGTAAYFTVYIEGRNNTVTNSRLEPGLAGHIYPNSSPHATYTNTTDALTGTLLAI